MSWASSSSASLSRHGVRPNFPVPSLRGWATFALGITLWVVGRGFGASGLEQVGFALVALVGIAVIIVSARRHDLVITRTLSPPRARAGQPVRVHLRIENEGRGSAPLLMLDDALPIELSGQARFALNGVEPGGTRDAEYEVRAPRRGRYEVGPLRTSIVDPFGLARTRNVAAGVDSLLVYPRIERLALPRDLGQQRSMAVSALRQLSGARGEDFYTMREYAHGDDLRKIHWPSTAKRAKPMIRQEETPWHTRATILLDDRFSAHEGHGDGSSFERAIEGAASLADLYHRSGYTYRLMSAHHQGRPTSRGTDHYHQILDALAVLEPGHDAPDHDSLVLRLAELESGTSAEGTLVCVTGELSDTVAVGITRCRRRFRQVAVIVYPGHRFGGATTKSRWEGEQQTRGAVTLLTRSAVPSLVLGPGEGLGAAWTTLSVGGRRGGDAWARKPELA